MTLENVHPSTEFIPLEHVESRLQQLWAAEGAAGTVRARTRNVVVVLHDRTLLESTIDLFASIGHHHPSRILVLVPNPETPDPGIAADARLVCPTGGTPAFCCEVILLHARTDVWHHVPAAVLVCLLPELPVYLWWRRPLDPDDALFRQLQPLVDVLLVDTGSSETPERTITTLGQVCHRFPWGCVDLTWTRLTAWREHVAQLFDPLDRRPFLKAVERVSMTVAPSPLGTAAALYFSSWLAERLGWEPRSRWRPGARSRELRFQANSHPVRLNVNRSHSTEDIPITRIRLHMSGIIPATFTVALGEDSGQAEVTVEMSNTRLRQVHLMRGADTRAALHEALALNGRDWIFERTLHMALRLLSPPSNAHVKGEQ